LCEPATPRQFWVSRFERLHAHTNGRGTRNSSAIDPQDIRETLSNNFLRAALRRNIYLLFTCGVQRLSVTTLLKQRAMPMKILGATAVAALALYVTDQFLTEGRYFEIVADALKQVGQFVGIPA
jgi:hypothetical protein